MRRPAFLWALAAIGGIVLVAGMTLAASRLSALEVGLSSEPLQAGQALAPTATPSATTTAKPKAKKKTPRKRRPKATATPRPPAVATATPAAPAPVPTVDDHGGHGSDDGGGDDHGSGGHGSDD